MDKAAFNFIEHRFYNVELDFENFQPNSSINMQFNPSGVYDSESGKFELTFIFQAFTETIDGQKLIAKIICNADFLFNEKIKLSEIPDFFYPNSIAIVFPYIRAFIGSVSLLANIHPLVLPTMNLTPLRETLKNNTSQKSE